MVPRELIKLLVPLHVFKTCAETRSFLLGYDPTKNSLNIPYGIFCSLYHFTFEEIEMDSTFDTQFCFKPELSGRLGIERECFLTEDNIISPKATTILNCLPSGDTYGYELSACQLEMRTTPTTLANLHSELSQIELLADSTAKSLGLGLLHIPVAPANMPVDVYPDPTGRYAHIVQNLPHNVLVAACRVAAVHIHIGVSNKSEAVEVYNRLVERFDELKEIGNTCDGQRLELYRLMASDDTPPHYSSWNEYHTAMHERGCANDPRQCWDMVRISRHGTVEVRVFDSVPDITQIVSWAEIITRFASINP